MKQPIVLLPLTPEESRNLAIMLQRVPVTGVTEASALVIIANKLQQAGQPKQAGPEKVEDVK